MPDVVLKGIVINVIRKLEISFTNRDLEINFIRIKDAYLEFI